MNRYKTVIIPAHDKFSEVLAGKVDSEAYINVIGVNAFTDIMALTRELVDKAYKAGYTDCEDKHQQKAELLKAFDTSGLTGCMAWGRIVKDCESVAKQAYKAGYVTCIENLKAGGHI